MWLVRPDSPTTPPRGIPGRHRRIRPDSLRGVAPGLALLGLVLALVAVVLAIVLVIGVRSPVEPVRAPQVPTDNRRPVEPQVGPGVERAPSSPLPDVTAPAPRTPPTGARPFPRGQPLAPVDGPTWLVVVPEESARGESAT